MAAVPSSIELDRLDRHERLVEAGKKLKRLQQQLADHDRRSALLHRQLQDQLAAAESEWRLAMGALSP